MLFCKLDFQILTACKFKFFSWSHQWHPQFCPHQNNQRLHAQSSPPPTPTWAPNQHLTESTWALQLASQGSTACPWFSYSSVRHCPIQCFKCWLETKKLSLLAGGFSVMPSRILIITAQGSLLFAAAPTGCTTFNLMIQRWFFYYVCLITTRYYEKVIALWSLPINHSLLQITLLRIAWTLLCSFLPHNQITRTDSFTVIALSHILDHKKRSSPLDHAIETWQLAISHQRLGSRFSSVPRR